MRMGDIMDLTWERIQHSDTMGYFVRFSMNKTKSEETLPISDEAMTLLGEPSKVLEDRVFPDYNFRLPLQRAPAMASKGWYSQENNLSQFPSHLRHFATSGRNRYLYGVQASWP